MNNSVLIVGSGGREHALLKALLRSKRDLTCWMYPGNVGMERDGCRRVDTDIHNWDDLAQWALANKIDLTVVGPEIPLTEGIVDIFNAQNLTIFGPSKSAAQLEGSKFFSKELMRKYAIPTAQWDSFTDKESAIAYLEQVGAPIVVKVSGLAAGKGVVVCETMEEAMGALTDIFDQGSFGDAGNRVVIEEMMYGEEASIFVVTDGDSYRILPVAQDHKRIFDNDKGANTGGMGAYSPTPLIDSALMSRIEKEIITTTLVAMKQENAHYRGLLYVGIMVTDTGPRVVEYNCRFGDPETEAVLPLVDCDWFALFEASATGKIEDFAQLESENYGATVVLASKGYPAKSEVGQVIYGIEDAEKIPQVDVYHAGTSCNEKGELLTAGGRVLAVTAWETTLEKAIEKVYTAVGKISFSGMQFRKDIAQKGLKRLTDKE